MEATEKKYGRITPDNSLEILLYLLSADSTGEPAVSTHPLIIAGRKYTPCEIITPDATQGGFETRSISDEIRNLYQRVQGNPEELHSFWRGIDAIVREFEDLTTTGKLGNYGSAELLEAFFNIDIPPEDTLDVPANLKKMITSGRYAGVPAVLWPPWPAYAQGRKVWDLQFKAVRAYGNLQRGESPEFWKELIDDPPAGLPDYNGAIRVFFRGLGICDIREAKTFVFQSKGLDESLRQRVKRHLEHLEETLR